MLQTQHCKQRFNKSGSRTVPFKTLYISSLLFPTPLQVRVAIGSNSLNNEKRRKKLQKYKGHSYDAILFSHKRTEEPIHAKTWINPENTMLYQSITQKQSLTQKAIYLMILFV